MKVLTKREKFMFMKNLPKKKKKKRQKNDSLRKTRFSCECRHYQSPKFNINAGDARFPENKAL
jgi:hypothetical protein